MTRYTDRPWLPRYSAGLPADLVPEHDTMPDAFRAAVRRSPAAVAIRYFDGTLTLAELDAASDALAVALADRGFGPGDRLALYLQNDPAFVVGLLAAWKAGGMAVAVNPMNKARELEDLLVDSGAVALLFLWKQVSESLFLAELRATLGGQPAAALSARLLARHGRAPQPVLAAHHRADAVEEEIRRGVLEQDAAGAEAERARPLVFFDAGGQHDRAQSRHAPDFGQHGQT